MIPIEELEEGRFYQVEARNFGVAIYKGEGIFLGLRESFGDLYISEEEHWDACPTHGTVSEVQKLELKLSKHICNYEEKELIEMLIELEKEFDE